MRRGAALLLILLGTLWGAGGATAQAPPTVPHIFFSDAGTEVTLDGVTLTDGRVRFVATTPDGDVLAEVQVDLPLHQPGHGFRVLPLDRIHERQSADLGADLGLQRAT